MSNQSDINVDQLYEALVLEKVYTFPMFIDGKIICNWQIRRNFIDFHYLNKSSLRVWQSDSHADISKFTDVVYFNNENKIHRIYGPAYISKNFEMWFKNGILHRENNPAVIHKENKFWFLDGKLHRLDGPAIIDPCGPRRYFINGQELPPKEYKKEINRRKRKGLIK